MTVPGQGQFEVVKITDVQAVIGFQHAPAPPFQPLAISTGVGLLPVAGRHQCELVAQCTNHRMQPGNPCVVRYEPQGEIAKTGARGGIVTTQNHERTRHQFNPRRRLGRIGDQQERPGQRGATAERLAGHNGCGPQAVSALIIGY